MGIFGFFAPMKEESLHRALAEILTDYHKIRAILENGQAPAEHLRTVHTRMDSIQSAIRYANTISDKAQRLAVLHHHVMAERSLLPMHKQLADRIEQNAKQIERYAKRVEKSARRLRAA